MTKRARIGLALICLLAGPVEWLLDKRLKKEGSLVVLRARQIWIKMTEAARLGEVEDVRDALQALNTLGRR